MFDCSLPVTTPASFVSQWTVSTFEAATSFPRCVLSGIGVAA